jgi:crossover junction endodeoxyribonuclease RuvC
MTCIRGIDPGVTGGIAFLSDNTLAAFDIPNVAGEVDIDAIVRLVHAYKPDMAVVERASSMPKQGVASTFKYGVAYGALRTVVAVLAIPYHLVTPQKWKKFSGSTATRRSRARSPFACGLAWACSNARRIMAAPSPR